MTLKIVYLTEPQIKALVVAANAMLAGEEGEGDFSCSAAVLERAIVALNKTKSVKQKKLAGEHIDQNL